MALAATIFALLTALLHMGFMVLESILWTKPTGRKIFGLTKDAAAQTADLALNQGIYNACVALAIGWFVYRGNTEGVAVMMAFVVIVGIAGGLTVSKSILVLQALPAAIALGLLIASRNGTV